MSDDSPLAGVSAPRRCAIHTLLTVAASGAHVRCLSQNGPTHRRTTSRGGLATLLVAALLVLLCIGEVREYIGGAPAFAYDVQREIGSDMQINLDITVAMKCHCECTDRSGWEAVWV